MNYLQQLLNNHQNGPIVKTHNSLESLIGSILPNLNAPAVVKDGKKQEPIITKELAQNLLMSNKDKIELEKINEEIKNDLKDAFINEHITIQEASAAHNYYKLYRDKDETFECKISVEGAIIGNMIARLVLETDIWNILFNGKVYKDGRCLVPLKKMTVFPEGTIGKARLEILIDDSIFIPWEETFIVEGSKKIKVEVMPQGKISVNIKDQE